MAVMSAVEGAISRPVSSVAFNSRGDVPMARGSFRVYHVVMSASRDDRDLVVQARQGSPDAFEELVRRHQAPVYRYLWRMCRNRAEAEDLAQESLAANLTAQYRLAADGARRALGSPDARTRARIEKAWRGMMCLKADSGKAGD